MRTPAATLLLRSQNSGVRSQNLGLMQLLEEVSKLLEAYARSILDSGSWLLTT
jgi:hypothetical protein